MTHPQALSRKRAVFYLNPLIINFIASIEPTESLSVYSGDMSFPKEIKISDIEAQEIYKTLLTEAQSQTAMKM